MGIEWPDEFPRNEVEATRLINSIYRRAFWAYRKQREDLCQEGWIGLLGALRKFDPTKGPWATYAHGGIRNRMHTAIRSWMRKGGKWDNPIHVTYLSNVTPDCGMRERLVPESPDWFCLECRRAIDRTDRVTMHYLNYGLCRSCARRRQRVKAAHGGMGVCEKHGRVMNSSRVRGAYCKQCRVEQFDLVFMQRRRMAYEVPSGQPA